MPNWVYNSVSISGKAEDVKAFADKANKPRPDGFDKNEVTYEDSEGLSFWNFVAPPDEAIESGEYFGTNGFVNGKEVGKTKFNWYEWNIANWGVKWDAGDVSMEFSADEKSGMGYISGSYQTAWGIPEPVMNAMVEQHPELEFSFYCEEEQGWGAEYSGEKGELTLTKEWDIPDSHADYSERDNIDGCRCAWESDPHEWYEDCEDRESALADYHSENPDNDCECEIVSSQEPDVVY